MAKASSASTLVIDIGSDNRIGKGRNIPETICRLSNGGATGNSLDTMSRDSRGKTIAGVREICANPNLGCAYLALGAISIFLHSSYAFGGIAKKKATNSKAILVLIQGYFLICHASHFMTRIVLKREPTSTAI